MIKIELGGVATLRRADCEGRGPVVLKQYQHKDRMQFRAETQALSALQGCQGIVTLVQIDCDYFVMDFYPNGDLFSKVARHRVIPVPHVKKYAISLLRAISACHNAGFAHLDIKLDNILIAADGSLCLTDFGMSVRSTRCAYQRGTIEYIAPEVLQPYFEGHQFNTFSADMWSCGICVFIMLHGTPPFHSASTDCPHFNLFRTDKALFWRHHEMPADAAEFLQSMLVIVRHIESVRPSAVETLAHPWLQGELPAEFF